MEIKKIHILGGAFSLIVILTSLLFIQTKFFFFILGIGVIIGVLPFVLYFAYEAKIDTEKEEMFLEFARNLVESVKTGTPIGKSISNIKEKNYGILSENVKKLANQINLGIPLGNAIKTFAKDVNNKPIARALTLIGRAEKEGGEIGEILESVAEAVSLSDKLKKEQKAAISTLVVQGYIIFFVFIGIILIMQFKIIPMISGISGSSGLDLSGEGSPGEVINPEELTRSFLYLLLIQGFFSGLTIGKLAEGSIKSGVKHSFGLMISSFLISTGASLFFGG